MDTPHPNRPEGNIVYIREVPVAALPDEIRAQLPGVEQVWGVHAQDGACLALARDRALAFVVARQNDLVPVSAH
jgi:hypothetical protein